MSELPHPSSPSDPQSAQHAGGAAPGQSPAAPQRDAADAAGEKSGPGRGVVLAIVASGLLVLVILLSLVGFFGARALMGEGDAAQPITSQAELLAQMLAV